MLVVAAGVGPLLDVIAVGGPGGGNVHDLAAVAGDQDVAAVDGGLHVLAPGDVHEFLRVGLVHLVAVAPGDLDGVGASRAVAVEEDIPVRGDKAVAGGGGLSFRGADEGLHLAGGGAVDRGGGPVRAMFGVAQTDAVAGLHEFAPGVLGGSPPDAGVHAVFGSDHRLDDVVEFVVDAVVAVRRDVLEEGDVIVEAAGQLVGGALFHEAPAVQRVVPGVGLVVVEGCSAVDVDSSEVCAQGVPKLPDDVAEAVDIPLFKAVVRLVVGGDGQHGAACGNGARTGRVDQLRPGHGFDTAVAADEGGVIGPGVVVEVEGCVGGGVGVDDRHARVEFGRGLRAEVAGV